MSNIRSKSRNAETQSRLQKNAQVSLGVGTVEGINSTTLFSSFLNSTFTQFMQETGKYLFFPTSAALASIQAILAWREAYLNGGKKGSVIRASVETGAALAITATVIGTLVGQSLFAVAGPYVFATVYALKTLYHKGAALYYWGKSVTAEDPRKRQHYKELAKGNAVAFGAGLIATAGVVAVMILGKPIMAVLGIIAGVIGTIYTAYKSVQLFRSMRADKQARNSVQDDGAQSMKDLKPLLQAKEKTVANNVVAFPAHKKSFGLFSKINATFTKPNNEVNAIESRRLVNARQMF